MSRWESSFPEPIQWMGDEPDPYPGGRPEPQEPPKMCDRCHGTILHQVSHPSFGVFCSRACLDAEEAEFSEFMQRKGFQQVGVKK